MAVRRKLTRKQFEKKSQEILASIGASCSPFENNSDAARRERVERGKVGHDYFKRTYLPHYFSKPSGKIHKELDDMLYMGGKALCGAAFPREHGKSTHATLFAPLHQALYDISPYTIIISDTFELAAEFVYWIRLEIEENPRIKADFGDLVHSGWWEEGDILIGGKNRVRGVGARQRIRGTRFRQFRPKLIIIDDLENDINVLNRKLVDRTFKWLLGAVYGSMDDDGTQLMVGTMLKKYSVLAKLKKHIEEIADELREKFGVKNMAFRLYSAIVNGRPIWPEGKSLKMLLQTKVVMGPIVWAAEYLNEPNDDGIFQEDWFTFYQREIVLLLPRPWIYFSGHDASARSLEIHDYKAHVVLAQDAETRGTLYVADAWIRKAPIPDFIAAFFELYMEYRMVACGFEVNNFQIYIKDEVEQKMYRKGYYPNIIEVTQTIDKILRVGRLAGPVKRAGLQFCKGHGDQKLLVEQFQNLGGSMEDDGPDATEMAVYVAENYGGKIEKPARSKKKRAFSPGSRIGAGMQRIGAMIKRGM